MSLELSYVDEDESDQEYLESLKLDIKLKNYDNETEAEFVKRVYDTPRSRYLCGEDEFPEEEGPKPEVVRDYSDYDPADGPPLFEENEVRPEIDFEFVDFTQKPKMDENVDMKKQKEAKKKAEKDAKMKKFLAKQEKMKEVKSKPQESSEKTKSKPDKGKSTISAEELLASLGNIDPGNKKPTSNKMPDAYDPKYVEAFWYEWWVKEGFFKPEYRLKEDTLTKAVSKRGKFVIVIPPPNVTGTLHLGHALTCALEDVLTRWNRMIGKVTLWVPGCDHAGIATQMVVEKALQKEGKSRHDLGREEFIKRVWEWKEEKGGRIYEQLKKMGISADWDRESFTMSPKLSRAVTTAFIKLFDWGFIYRSDRLVNWSCSLKSCISDIEVDKVELTGRTFMNVPGYKDKIEFGVLTSFAYKIDDDNEIIVATTRPETMLGDVAVAVHPDDPRYANLIGKTADHPFINRKLIIIKDSYVDKDFGTGAVKITPAHDPNDYDIGKRHELEFIPIINEDGVMKDNCGKFSGMKRFEARKAVIEELKKLNLYRDAQEHAMTIPVCSRSKDIVEPLIKPQWYVSCDKMAEDALSLAENEVIKILPEIHRKTWTIWMKGIRDWCISRQLWWGHQIPAYKILKVDGEDKSEQDEWIAATSEEEAMAKAKKKFADSTTIELQRDEDVLDTWFSSALFPFSVFGWPDDTEELRAFYPTELLETGHDILFFWVARMVFMASTITQSIPFGTVFLHSIVRDAHGRKMSKSLGNVIDPLNVVKGITLAELHDTLKLGNLDPKEIETAKRGQERDYPNGIPECGTDALRFALCACMTEGRDINLDVLRVQGYRFFCNKIWNAVKFSMNYLTIGDFKPDTIPPVESTEPEDIYCRMDQWILSRLCRAVRLCNESLAKYDFQESTTAIYNFWLYDFCDVYLESLKPKFWGCEDNLSLERKRTLNVLLQSIEAGLRLLSPFMPFLTEELWQRIPRFPTGRCANIPSICVAPYPSYDYFRRYENDEIEKEVAFVNRVVHTIRSSRAVYNLPKKTKAEVFLLNEEEKFNEVIKQENDTLCALSSSKSVELINNKQNIPSGCTSCVVSDSCTAYVLLKGLVDLNKESERVMKQLATTSEIHNRLEETMAKGDYSEKVPKNVQLQNDEKLKTLKGEIKSLEEAMSSIKLMLSGEE